MVSTTPRAWPGGSVPDVVLLLRTVDDCLAIRERLAARPRVVVVGGGFIGVGDTGLIVNPGSPLVGVAQHLVAYQTVAAMVDANARNATQAAAMQYLAEFARSELERLDAPTFRSPAPLAERSGEEPPAAQ